MQPKRQTLLNAFRHAFNGMFYFLRHDRNGKIHIAIAIIVAIAGVFFRVSEAEWLAMLVCFALVVSLEMSNHALENLCDLVHADHHPLVKTVKDVAAAAVLWSAIASAVIGAVIFVPKILLLL